MPDPHQNHRVPDEVLVQSIGHSFAWQVDDRGAVYDAEGVFVADSLHEAAEAMRSMGWFVPASAESSGVVWREIPKDPIEATHRVQGAELRHRQP